MWPAPQTPLGVLGASSEQLVARRVWCRDCPVRCVCGEPATGATHVGRGRVDASVAWRLCAECLCSLGELTAPSRASRAAPASTVGALGRGGRTGARAARRSRWRLAGRVAVCQATARRGVQDAGGRAGAGPPEPAPDSSGCRGPARPSAVPCGRGHRSGVSGLAGQACPAPPRVDAVAVRGLTREPSGHPVSQHTEQTRCISLKHFLV